MNHELLDAAFNPLIAFDAREKIIYRNQAAKDQLGAQEGAFLDLFAENECEAIRSQWDSSGLITAELMGGKEAFFSVYPLLDERGVLIGRVARFYDDPVLQGLGSQRRELELFAANSAPLLKQNLEEIQSGLDELGRGFGEAEYFRYVSEACRRLEERVADLSRFLEAGRVDELEEVDGKKVVEDVLSSLNRSIEKSAASVSVADLPRFQGARLVFLELMQNLIGNALCYVEKGSKPVVSVGFEELPNRWRFFVRDQGIGIPKEQREKIFGLFERLHTAEEYPGTGVGLATCKKLVERHGGSIWVEEAVPKGSIFYFELPKAER